MGENAPLTGSGIANVQGVNAVFNNNAGGDISIKQTAVDGVKNELNSTFNNNACAKLTMFDNLNNAGNFTNAGLFTVNTAQTHTNTALTNNGVIEYPLGNPIANVTNNDIVVAPISMCGTSISPALQIGGTNNFTAGSTWYSDASLTTPAGTYNQGTNTFTLTNLALLGIQTMYFSVNDASNPCPKTVSIQVTIKALPVVSAPAASVCVGSTITLSPTSGGTWASSSPTIASVTNGGVVTGVAVGNVTFTFTETSTGCSATTSSVTVVGPPIISLNTLQQTLTEGNNQTLCDTDANPVNSLQFNVSGLCVSGSPVWRVQVGSGAWSAWSATAPVSQPSNNQPHRYQAACDGNCASTYSGVIELTIGLPPFPPQQVTVSKTTGSKGETVTLPVNS